MALAKNGNGNLLLHNPNERKEVAIANALLKAGEDTNCPGRVFITHPVLYGAKVDLPFSDAAAFSKQAGLDERITYSPAFTGK